MLPLAAMRGLVTASALGFVASMLLFPFAIHADKLAQGAAPWLQGFGAIPASLIAVAWRGRITWVYALMQGPLIVYVSLAVRDATAIQAVLEGLGSMVSSSIFAGVSLAVVLAAARLDSVAERARELKLGDVLKLGSGELKSGGFRRDSILADAFEALVAAIYRDGGFHACRDWLRAVFAGPVAAVGPPQKDPKTRLQEWLQARGLPLPHYELLAEHGEEHARQFDVACVIEQPRATRFEGSGGSRRAAEQVAAEAALEHLEQAMA